MRLNFEATKAGFDADEYALVCGVASTDHYLTFQREAEGSGEDWGVHLEYDDQINGDYDCVRPCHLCRSELRVELDRQLGPLAGIDGFTIKLHLDDASFEGLKAGLVAIFRGMSGALEIA